MPGKGSGGNRTALRNELFKRLEGIGIQAYGEGASEPTIAIAAREILSMALANPTDPQAGETLADTVFNATLGDYRRDEGNYRRRLERMTVDESPIEEVHPAVLSVRALHASVTEFPDIQAAGAQALAALHAANREGIL